MIYDDEISFKIKNGQELIYIYIPRKINYEQRDLSAKVLYNEVKRKINKEQFDLSLNGKKIHNVDGFPLSSLQYLPYQQIIVENINTKQSKNKNYRRIKVKYDPKDFPMHNNDEKPMKEYSLSDLKIETILDLKKIFAYDISNDGKNPINPYELFISTKQRYVGDDENVNPIYMNSKFIVSRRSNNDALYPLFFRKSDDNKCIKKWYNQDTTFGQIAFDFFGDKYYEYTFKLDSEEKPRNIGPFTFSSKVDQIKILKEGKYQILNQFIIEKNTDQNIHFSFLNFLKGEYRRNRYSEFPYIYNNKIKVECPEEENNESMRIYNIHKNISANIFQNLKCSDLLLDKKINLKAKISDYGDPYASYDNTQLIYGQPKSNCSFKVYFYNEKKYKFIYMDYFSTIFDLRYCISVNSKVNFENILIFHKNVDEFKREIDKKNKPEHLDDCVILKNAKSDMNYIVYIISKEENTGDTNLLSNEVISKGNINNDNCINTITPEIKIIDTSQNGNEKTIVTNLESFSDTDGSKTKDKATYHDKMGDKIENQEKRFSIYPLIENPESLYSKKTDNQNDYISSSLLNTDETNDEQNKKEENENPRLKKKPSISKFVPKKLIEKSSTKESDNKSKILPEKSTTEKPEYLKLKFKYDNIELSILHPPDKNKDLTTLEPRIRRFYKIDNKIDFFYENNPTKKINNLKLNEVKTLPIIIKITNEPLEKNLYYIIYGKSKQYKINDVETVEQLKDELCEIHHDLKLDKINIIYGGKILKDEMKLDRLYSTKDAKIILTVYNDESIFDFSGTVMFDKDLKEIFPPKKLINK